jgi:hypothetical protein
MNVFADYVNRYSDLKTRFEELNKNETDRYNQSVINPTRRRAYLDATNSYEDLQKASQNYNWEHYVWTGGSPTWSPDTGPCFAGAPRGDCQSDLEYAWREHQKNNPGASKAEWGKKHWTDYGSKPNENRAVPFNGLDTVLWSAHQYVVRHSQLYNNGVVPEIYKDQKGTVKFVSGEAGWGQEHWNEYGKNENRILSGAKLAVDSNGKLYLANTDAIGVEAKKYYDGLVASVNNARPGEYKALMEGLKSALGDEKFNDLIKNNELNVISGVYQKKLSAWDAKTQGAQPPVGGFDPSYYALNTTGGAEALKQWNAADKSVNVGGIYLPDLDIKGRYTKDTFLQWYYTTQGKAAGERGNAALEAQLPKNYKEYLTDADYQAYRDQVLGLADRFDNIKDWADAQDPTVLNEWYASLPSSQKAEYDAGTLPVPTLDYIPDRLRDKVKMSKGTTLLEGRLSGVLGEKEAEKQKMFTALTSDSLKQAALQLQKAKLQEQQYDFYSGLPGINEVLTINESIANSILGDTGVGGIFGWMGDTEKTQEGLEKSLFGATGIPSRSNSVYNWQKWFDDELVKRYEKGLTVTDPLDASVNYNIDAEFAKDYIDRYLKPRFDNSKSMGEFVSYMDVKQNEQNIFQTQSALDSLRSIADLRSKAYLDGIKSTAPLNFNTDFYWNPEGNFEEDENKYQTYQRQKNEIAADWETAKTKGDVEKVPGTDWTWNQWAYYYGLNPADKNQFAKLHYQIKGAAAGFDPAKDLITLKDADEYIQNKILPEIADEKLKIGDITFLNFVTPEEYADKLLEGISPESHKEEWDKLLQTLGLSEKEMGVTEVKQYIIDAFRTGAAKEIRESIKYLNEKRLTPTQERLGVEYIERPEDAAATDDPNATALYKIFKNAGYQGNEDEFYSQFMTDVDRGEMELVTQAGKGLQTSSLFSGLSSKDPFESLVSIQSLFDEEDKSKTTGTEEKPAPSYFKLFEDETKDEDYKSKSGQKILGEFTSFFKGFT